jgi:hypothetical protein
MNKLSLLTKQLKVCKNRGLARVWIESMLLAKYGFKRYDCAYVSYNSTGIVISKKPIDGNEIDCISANNPIKIAGRSRNNRDIPIIDLNNKSVDQLLSNCKTYVIDYLPNQKIIITKGDRL